MRSFAVMLSEVKNLSLEILRRLRWLRMTIVAGVLAFAVLFLVKDEIVRLVLESKITSFTGFKARMARLSCDFPSAVRIRHLRLDNPEGFEASGFALLPEVRFTFDLGELILGRRFHLQNLRLFISEIHLEKKADGISNVSLLAPVAWARSGRAGPLLIPPEERQGLAFRADRLELTLREISLKDFTKGEQSVFEDLEIENDVTKGLNDPRAIVYRVLVQFLYRSHFADLGLDPFSLHQALKKAAAA